MIQGPAGFFDGIAPLSGKELKRGGGVSFLSKRDRLQMQIDRLEEKMKEAETLKQKKQADLMLLDGEDSDEDFFKYKVSAKDMAILQRAKQEEKDRQIQQLGLGFVQPQQQQQQQQLGFNQMPMG